MKLKQGIPPSRIMNVEGVITASVMSSGSERYTWVRNFLSSLNSEYEIELLDIMVDASSRILMLVDKEKFDYDQYVE